MTSAKATEATRPSQRLHPIEREIVHDAELFKEVMSQFATGVTVVTGVDRSGIPVGFTANAVASVSLEPPLILACADRRSSSLPALVESGSFAVSVLRAEDAEIAHRFSEKIRDERFRELELVGTRAGPPALKNALAWLGCRVWRDITAGDHVVLIGEVIDGGIGPEGPPLVFFRGEFTTVAELSAKG